jgi:two-component system, cell cycle response regulator
MPPQEEKTLTAVSSLPTRAQGRRAYLLVVASALDSGKLIRLDRTRVLIGRAPDADVQIQDSSISRHHVVLRLSDGHAEIEDLGSKNGTFVHGERVEASRVEDGDKFQLGSTVVLKLTWQDDQDEAMQQTLYDSATRDPLTGIYNKRYLLEMLQKDVAYCNRHQVPLTVVFADVDHFKQVNDTFGHAAGDAVLKRVAEIMESSVRREDTVARFGGEEFALMLRDCDGDAGFAFAERVRRRIAESDIVWGEEHIPVTISLGVAQLRREMVDGQELLTAADRNLYRAKRAGRNRVDGKAISGP